MIVRLQNPGYLKQKYSQLVAMLRCMTELDVASCSYTKEADERRGRPHLKTTQIRLNVLVEQDYGLIGGTDVVCVRVLVMSGLPSS